MKQILTWCLSTNTASALTFYSPINLPGQATTAAAGSVVWPASGNFRNLTVRLSAAPGGAYTRQFNLRINASTVVTLNFGSGDTYLTAEGSDWAVTAGQLVTISNVASSISVTPARIDITLEFESGTAGESVQNCCSSSGASNSAVRYTNAFNYTIAWDASAPVGNLIPIDGDITGYYIKQQNAPGASKSFTYAFYKNGVKQDGSGGTVDTRVTITGASTTTGNLNFTLPVVAGDLIYIELTPAGTPTLPGFISIGTKFVSDPADKSFISVTYSAIMTHITEYYDVSAVRTTSEIEVFGAVNTVYYNNLRAKIQTVEGTSKKRTYSFFKNGNAYASFDIGGASDTTGNSTGIIEVTETDHFCLRQVPDSTSVINIFQAAFVQNFGNAPAVSSTFPALSLAI